MDDRYKRLNSATGDPFQAGYQDETGRIFLRYLNKQGNDGYYLEECAPTFYYKHGANNTVADALSSLPPVQD